MSIVPSATPTSRAPWLLLLFFILAPIALFYAVRPPRPSVILVTIDTLRPDRLGVYGYEKNRTPTIDRIAAEGMMFETAYCDMPWTTGSMSSVMTGQYSSSHGVDHPSKRLKDDAVTMAELLAAEGYQTAAIVASFPLDSVYGLDQGFETYEDEYSRPMIAVEGEKVEHVSTDDEGEVNAQGFVLHKFKNDAYRPDNEVSDSVIRWLDTARRDGPFFLWVHYFGPHEKMFGDKSFVSQEPRIVSEYDKDVETADRELGRVVDHLRELGILDDTLLIVHADHGQNLGEFGVVGHGTRVDEATVRIPMVMRYPPRIQAGLRREDVAQNVNVLPTVLDAVRARRDDLAGRSLLPDRNDPRGAGVPVDQQIAYFGTKLTRTLPPPLFVPGYWSVVGPVERTGMRTPDWRFVHDQVVGACRAGKTAERNPMGVWWIPGGRDVDEEECLKIHVDYLYAVSGLRDAEPEVSKEHPKIVDAMAAALRHHASEQNPLASPIELSPEQEEKLKSLGYLK